MWLLVVLMASLALGLLAERSGAPLRRVIVPVAIVAVGIEAVWSGLL